MRAELRAVGSISKGGTAAENARGSARTALLPAALESMDNVRRGMAAVKAWPADLGAARRGTAVGKGCGTARRLADLGAFRREADLGAVSSWTAIGKGWGGWETVRRRTAVGKGWGTVPRLAVLGAVSRRTAVGKGWGTVRRRTAVGKGWGTVRRMSIVKGWRRVLCGRFIVIGAWDVEQQQQQHGHTTNYNNSIGNTYKKRRKKNNNNINARQQ